jgi:hypothetical protein
MSEWKPQESRVREERNRGEEESEGGRIAKVAPG